MINPDKPLMRQLVFRPDLTRPIAVGGPGPDDPTQEEIRIECLRIQKGFSDKFPGWSDVIRRHRDQTVNYETWDVPFCEVEDD